MSNNNKQLNVIYPNSYPENETPTRCLNFQEQSSEYHTAFCDFQKRKDTFKKWPYEKPNAFELASAGFFSLNSDDKVICFYCGGGLHKWTQTDNAWEQHAKWFPKCKFVIANKGESFIADIQNKDPPILHIHELQNMCL